MRSYYRDLIVAVGTISLILMGITYVLVMNYFPTSSQNLASSIAIAFEGFLLGGAFQFLLEGRRIKHKDTEDRIDVYHRKLKAHVIDFWSSRTLERRNTIHNFGTCDENLYLFLDLESFADPDKRYLRDAISHFGHKKYNGVIQLRGEIIQRADRHNSSVKEFVDSKESLKGLAQSIGFVMVNASPRDPLAKETVSEDAMWRYYAQYFKSPEETKLVATSSRPPEGPTMVLDDRYWGPRLSFIWEGTWMMVASSKDSSKIERLSSVLSEFAPGYRSMRGNLERESKDLELSLDSLKNRVLPIGYDIEEYTFTGKCSYEGRLND